MIAGPSGSVELLHALRAHMVFYKVKHGNLIGYGGISINELRKYAQVRNIRNWHECHRWMYDNFYVKHHPTFDGMTIQITNSALRDLAEEELKNG